MKIQVFGSGCTKCKKLHELVTQTTQELGIQDKVEYSTDVSKIIEMGIMSSPVLVIDGKAVLVGFTPDTNRLKQIITSSIKKS